MAINTNLLVSAVMLQDYIVNKSDGFPLANGIISLYKDNARSFYKNWYYQTGTPGAYTWVALDNPMHLSSVGTIQDPHGNDVIPFFYPYEETNENIPETYYITVYSSDENGDPATLQFTRENFPFVANGLSPIATVPTLKNIIANNVYWRNAGPLDLTNILDRVIAPSQHDNYTNPDIRFLKSKIGGSDHLAFLPMNQSVSNEIAPEYYLNMKCTGATTDETQKCIQYPLSMHLKTLSNVQATLTITAQSASGNVNNYIDVYIYQYLGYGVTPSSPILKGRLTLGQTFQKQTLSFTFPSSEDLTLGTGGDDALFLQIQYPLNATFEINHTKPCVYLSQTVPDNDFQTYDEIETIINSPRTGDVRTSYNTFEPYGWVYMNDGSIGNASSSATARANIDTWPLFSLLYVNISDTYAPVSGGRTAPGNTIAAAYTDWNLNKSLTLPAVLGRALASAGNGSGLTPRTLGEIVGAETHVLTTNEMPSHDHGTQSPATDFITNGTGAGTTSGGGNIGSSATTGFTGGGQAHNIMQPTSFMNVFIKL